MRNAFVAILVTAMAQMAPAANHYVRQGASGNGSDWTNAYGALPTSLIRGDTYYIAAGNYGSLSFSTPGSQTITIKKATTADHGTNTGWVDSYGMNSANFTSWNISAGSCVLEGNTGSEKTGYGFVVHNENTAITIGNVSNVTLSHVEASTRVTTCDGETDLFVVLYAVSGGNGLIVQNSYLHESNSWAMMGVNGWSNVTFNGNYFMNACRKELLSSRNVRNLTFKNNYAENSAGTGILVFENPDSVFIYNNLFFTTNTGMYSTTNCLICNWYDQGGSASNVYIYGNTFANLQPQTMIGFDGGTNIVAQNNLFYGSNGISWRGSISHDYNWCFGGACSAVSSEAHGQAGASGALATDFRLTAPTTGGMTLQAPYNLDITGAERGADGTWDQGAFEYASGPSVHPALQSSRFSTSTPYHVYNLKGQKVGTGMGAKRPMTADRNLKPGIYLAASGAGAQQTFTKILKID